MCSLKLDEIIGECFFNIFLLNPMKFCTAYFLSEIHVLDELKFWSTHFQSESDWVIVLGGKVMKRHLYKKNVSFECLSSKAYSKAQTMEMFYVKKNVSLRNF